MIDPISHPLTTGGPANRPRQMLAKQAALFLDHCRVAKALSVHTLRAYRSDLDDLIAHVGGSVPVADIHRDTVRTYARLLLDVRRLKQATVKRRIATVKVFFRWMEREEHVQLSLFRDLEFAIRIPRRLPRALDRREIATLLERSRADAAADREHYDGLLMHFVVVALFMTGLRISELVTAKLEDVVAEDGALRVRGKGNRERRVYISGDTGRRVMTLYLSARESMGAHGRLLVMKGGRAVTAQSVRRRLRALGQRAGLSRRITPHMLRHTAATQLLEAGVDIRFVQRLLGHSSIVTTQIYAEVNDTALQTVLARADTLARLASN
jgi:integrase/recombinase XerD